MSLIDMRPFCLEQRGPRLGQCFDEDEDAEATALLYAEEELQVD